MKSKAITVLLGVVVASSFPVSANFGSAGAADAADVVSAPARSEAKVPEFVPVVNFSEFVLAMQTFAAQNPAAARVAAEALSAKFAFNSGAQEVELHKPTVQAAAQPMSPPTPIVTRPVAVSNVWAAPQPSLQPPPVPDPVKIVTGYSEEQPAPRKRHRVQKTAKAEKSEEMETTAAETPSSNARLDKRFEPAMGLGMVIDSAEEAPPISTLPQKKRKPNAAARDAE